MEARTNHKILSIVILTVLATICAAQQPDAVTPPPITADFNRTAATPAFPYIATVLGSNVHVRSGPGTNFYQCGKVNKGDTVTIVDNTETGWSRIVPPAGAFSWISMRYIEIDPNTPSVGLIKGNAVKVYVGSPLMDPIHSMQSQLTLNRGEVVTLLGESRSDYHKIAPPAGAYRWISTKYTKPITTAIPRVPDNVINDVIDSNTDVVVPPTLPTDPPIIDVPADSNQGLKLKEYYKLQKLFEAERAKPAVDQSYAELRKSFAKLAEDKEADKAARYSQFTLKQIDRLELALKIMQLLEQQNKALEQARANLKKATSLRIAEYERKGRYAVIGKFQIFTLYGPGHYRIIDESGASVCYALPQGAIANTDLSKFIGKKVGLVGKIESHRQTAGALVRFNEIVLLK
jgi:SH3-like domain-containing protein